MTASSVVITGGSRGIGAATAVAFAAQGRNVALTYRTDADAAAHTVASCVAHGTAALALPLDLSDHETIENAIEATFARVVAEWGPPAALVNNAAIVAPQTTVAETTAQRLRHIMDVNVIGAFLCARTAVRLMSTEFGGRGGSIVNVSSAAARLGSPGEYVDYAASKAALDTLTLGLAKEVATGGIRVNSVRLGVFDTDLHASGGRPDRAWRLAPMVPLRRPGDPAEAAAAITWLCSDAASYVTGAILDVSGGL
jgi:NAD(P)-dependent dehydrogenase (short-subunit alcohol dehydrogenase family)